MNIHYRHVSSTTGAVAAAASIISGLVGVAALFTAPHGLRRFALALHLGHQPLWLRIAPFVAAFAVLAAAVAGMLRLYSWCREHLETRRSEPATPEAS
jgi:hypothetical protein